MTWDEAHKGISEKNAEIERLRKEVHEYEQMGMGDLVARIEEQNAEIERLKEELELERHISGSADAHIGELRKLITELAEWCSQDPESITDHGRALLQRAREATK